jgi:hypothetical protein
MSWNRRFLLYQSADGQRSILDAYSGHRFDVARLARGLPGREVLEAGLVSIVNKAPKTEQ